MSAALFCLDRAWIAACPVCGCELARHRTQRRPCSSADRAHPSVWSRSRVRIPPTATQNPLEMSESVI
jgi:hypothetical protein